MCFTSSVEVSLTLLQIILSFAFKFDRTRIDAVGACNCVYQRSLPGAIRSHQADYFSGHHIKAQIPYRKKAAEMLGSFVD